MNTIKKILLAALCVAGFGGAQAVAAEPEEVPIITFRTNIYDTYGDTNSFHIELGASEKTYFDIDYGFGTEEVEVGVAYFDTDAQAMVGTMVQCRVSQEGIVRIYGDASKIDYLAAEGCYIDWIDMDACSNLEILNLQHNELKRLDLTPFTKLNAIYLTDNTFSAEHPLVVGPNKPDLMILEIDITEHIDPSFNLSDYPAMVSFDAYHCLDLDHIDPTGCPNLQVLSLELTNVSSVDVSQNQRLTRLNVSESRVTSLDLSKNVNLMNLLAEHVSGSINKEYKISSIDLSNNPNLVILTLAGNDLTDIDLSHNTLLTNLNLSRNKLSHINLEANTYLYSVNLAYNDMDFVTLPLPGAEWGEYYYYRNPLPCNRSYPVDSNIDFSSSVLRSGTTTTAKVWTFAPAAEAVELPEEEYTYTDGKISFKSAMTDSVYVEFANSAFPDYTLRSGAFKVKTAAEFGVPSQIVSFRPSSIPAGGVKFGVTIDGASAQAPRTLHVVAADGAEQTFAVTSADINAPTQISVNAVAAKDMALLVEEGDVLSSFVMAGVPLSALDISAATELRRLSVTDCSLRTIDMAYNRCLRSLDLSGNRLGNVSLAGSSGSYEKNVLTDIKAERNQIYNFEVVSTTQIKNLDLSDNRLTTFNLKNYDGIRSLDLSNNRMAEVLSLTYLAAAEEIDLHGNSLDSLTIDVLPCLKRFDVSDNNLSIRTLPAVASLPAGCAYTYAPQKNLYIVDKAPGINISAQYRMIDGEGTNFVWKKADGTVLVQGVDVDCNNGGTRFLKDNLGTVYCEMTHPAFPQFAGADVYKTTETLVVGAPTTVIASFTSTAGTDAANVVFRATKPAAVYIDWRGDGTEYLQYEVPSDKYASYTGQTAYAGANAKVYTYGEADELTVFSIYDVPMSQMDASPLTAVTAFSVGGAGLDEEHLKLPANPALSELNLEGNNFSTKTFEDLTNLKILTLSDNLYESFDASRLPGLQALALSGNKLTDITLNNPALWNLVLSNNEFSEISLSGLPALDQLFLAGNKFAEIDLSPVKNRLRVLDLTNNAMDFATLPRPADMPAIAVYYYGGQSPLAAECVDGKVDLSSQATVGETATEYSWYLGEVYVDADTGEVVGEALETGGDDPEYTVEGGVTYFHYTFSDKVAGMLVNAEYPNLVLFTVPVTIDSTSGISDVTADAADPDAIVDVYNVAGICVRRAVRMAEAFDGLDTGFYIAGGRKAFVRRR